MEMNLAYYEATLAHLQSKGFTIEALLDVKQSQGELVFNRKRVDCRLGDDCQLAFEALSYSDGHVDFYLEIIQMGRMKSFSFPLDSWKYHPNRIEFKYRDDPATGLGLAITLDLSQTS
jgi:hypothetical protein